VTSAITVRPEPSAPRKYSFPEVHYSTLSNGLRVAVAPIPRLPIVSVLALVDAGDSYDIPSSEGVASLTAQALGEGTTRLGGAALTDAFEMLGTGLDTATSWDEAAADLTVTPQRLEAAVSLLGEVLTSPAFDEGEVDRLKSERLAELLQQQTEPRSLADDKFSEFLYAASSRYAVPMAGSTKTVRRLGTSQVRQFHGRHYKPSATTVILVGDVSVELGVQLAERALGAWTGTKPTGTRLDDNVRSNHARIHVVNKADAPQTELRVGHRGVPRNTADYFPILVMNALLGGLFNSRINLNLREKNAFTYGARSAFEWRRTAGPFMVSTAVKTDVTDAATREILREIAKLREETVTAEELSLATAYLDGVFPIRFETTSAVADAIAMTTVYGLGADYFTRYRDQVRAVTAADVRWAAETYLRPDELLVVAVGDANAIQGPLEALGLGPAELHQAEDET
jgi:predicted Zn-dependent peptidase